MNILQLPPAGFDGIDRAFAMARQLPTTHQAGLRIGLEHEGVLFAVGELDGHRQLAFFCEHLRSLGWRERLLGGDEDMFGCDLLFSRPSDRADDDPSFIRRAWVERWPARG